MKFYNIFDINELRKEYENYRSMKLTKRKCNYKIKNVFYKNGVDYPHKQYIIDILNEIKNIKRKERKNNKNPFLKKFLFKESKKKHVTILVQFENDFKKEEKLYLIEFKFCSRKNLTFSSIAKKIKNMDDDSLKKETIFHPIDHHCKNKILLKLSINDTTIKKGYRIYQLKIIKGNEEVEISNPFTLASFKQLYKRGKEGFIGKQYEKFKKNKPNDLRSYLYPIYDPEEERFKDMFDFPLYFYTVQNDKSNEKSKQKLNESSNKNSKKSKKSKNSKNSKKNNKNKIDIFNNNNNNYKNINDNNNFDGNINDDNNSLEMNYQRHHNNAFNATENFNDEEIILYNSDINDETLLNRSSNSFDEYFDYESYDNDTSYHSNNS